MKKTWKIILSVIVLIALAILLLHLLGGDVELKLKEVEFTRDVSIYNSIKDKPEYDDIVYTGLEGLDIDNVHVLIA